MGWYHTHPDFGIFLSDRDRFIHEHFFSGPGQVAHVIDPIRQIRGSSSGRTAKPTLTPHFWVGDEVLTGMPGRTGGFNWPTGRSGTGRDRPPGDPGPARKTRAQGDGGDLLPPLGQLMIYIGVFLAGYLLSTHVLGVGTPAIRGKLGEQ